ncbi:MAG: metallophosphoesterase family protein [Actinomycetes bacterium]
MSTSEPSRAPWWQPWRRWPRTVVVAEILLIGVVGCWLGLLAGGRLDTTVGPLHTRMTLTPTTTGDSVLALPPLGELSLDSHDGPWRLEAEVTQIDEAAAREIFRDPKTLQGLPDQVVADVRSGTTRLVLQAGAAAVAGSFLLGVLVFRRRWRRSLAAAGVSLACVLAGGAAAAATWNPKAIDEPRYEGLLAAAPNVVGDARSIVSDFGKYEEQLAKIVTNVSRLYDVTSTLPVYGPSNSTIRVLFVSDLHLYPSAWEIIRSITQQFQIDVIVDTGDISDHGTATENRYVEPIGTLGVPYVFVRGNHDSLVTQQAVADQKGAVVLDNQVAEVAGLRIAGVGDPRFTPDKDTRGKDAPASVTTVAEGLADVVREQIAAGTPADVVMVHDPAMADQLDGLTPLVLAGHFHRREQHMLPAGTLLFQQGSTGASGLRGLEKGLEKPTPVRASVLYLDRDTRALQAWDDITLGGLGLTSAKIERRTYDGPGLGPPPTPSPTASATP